MIIFIFQNFNSISIFFKLFVLLEIFVTRSCSNVSNVIKFTSLILIRWHLIMELCDKPLRLTRNKTQC